MDEESDSHSLGAYENMERPAIHPDFDADITDGNYNDTDEKNNNKNNRSTGENLTNAAKNFLKRGEKNAESAGNTVKNAATKKAGETALNAATGGIGGTALKAAEKAGLTNATSILSGKKLFGKGMLTKALPLALIICLLMSMAAIMAFAGQSLFAIAFSRVTKQNLNYKSFEAHKVTDYQIANTQLGNANGESDFGDVVFNEMGFTDYQIDSFEQAGLQYEESDDGSIKALIHNNYDGSKTYIYADSVLGNTNTNETVGEDNIAITDSGNPTKTEAEVVATIAATLDTDEGDKIMKLSEALKDINIRREYITATNAYRGDMASWYNEMADTTSDRLNISRNNWKNFSLSGNNETDEKKVIEMASEKPSANSESDAKSVSYEELVDEVGKSSETDGCGTSSAFTAVESVATADQTARQVSAGSLWLEAIDKTVAGEGNKAPLNAATNIIVRAGGADTEGMHHLFGSKQMNQASTDVQSVSPQAQGAKNGVGSINLDALNEEEGEVEQYQTCIYQDNLQSHEAEGYISQIGSMFKRIGSWIKNRVSDIASFIKDLLKGGARDSAGAVVAALEPTVAKFNQMKNQAYFTGNDSKLLGEVMTSSSERWLFEQAKSEGLTAGDTGAVKTAYRVQQEIVAERAEYDRATRGQFDPTSEHTFLGKIAYSLIPFATSTSSISLTSTVKGIGSLVSGAMASLLPTSSALSETELAISQGDCVHSNSIGGFSNAHCNSYGTFDVDYTQKTPVQIFNSVAKMRYDEGGYIYGISESEKSHTLMDNPRAIGAPDYGKGPLNDAEDNLEAHWPTKGDWGEGTPNGCESSWEYEMRDTGEKDALGNPIYKEYYFWDYPTEWKYSRITNFEYEGYKTGWPNRTSASTASEREEAKNDADPGQCMLDLKTDDEKQPVINENGALGVFLIAHGQRGSEIGVSDYNIAEYLATTDFIKGRIHPCKVGSNECSTYKTAYDWSDDPDENLKSKTMSHWIGGSTYIYKTNDQSMMNKGYLSDEIFDDPTRNGAKHWEETKLYQAYTSVLSYLESIDKINSASTSKAVLAYYEKNPLDQSYAGIIARYSGLKKDTVIAVLDLVNYSEFLANYDPTNLYPLPAPKPETIEYDNGEIVAEAEKVITTSAIVYDELRNRTITV